MVWSYICAAKAEICVYNSRDCEDRGRDIRTPRRGRELVDPFICQHVVGDVEI